MGKSRQEVKAQKECFACLQDQARRWSENIAHSYVQTLKRDENGVSAFPPPYLAITLYSLLSQERGVQDLYEQIKLQCIKKTHKLLQGIDPLALSPKEGIEFAVMGNVIDYGSASSFEIENFDLQKEREKLEFACFEFEKFEQKLHNAKKIVILADNAGENLFDELMISSLIASYPHLKFYYFLRGYPIINDLTLKDLQNPYCQNIFSLAEVVDSGVRSPGFIYAQSLPKAREIYDDADLIIAKGMGNYECMEEHKDERVFFLLKIKCQVVAKHLNMPLGKMVFKQNL